MSKSEQMLTALQNQDLAQAEKYFEEALSQDTDQELLELADYLESIGFFPQAKRIYEKLAPLFPESYISLATIAADDGDLEEAFAYLEEIGSESEWYVAALLAKADLYQLEGLPDVAREKLLEAAKLSDEPLVTFGFRPTSASQSAGITCMSLGRVWNLLEGCRGELRPVLRALAVVSVGLLAVALVLGRSAVAAVNGYYVQGAVGAVMLTLVQLAYLPNIVVWVASFALGAGFSVGRGTDFSAFGVTSLQLPAIPVFGALPSPGVRMAWLPVLLACLALAWFVWRSRAYSSLKEASAAAGACLGCLLALGIAAAFLSGGAIGPGRMSDVGPRPLPLGLGFALAIGLPCVLGLVAPRAAAALRSRATGRPQEADAEEGPSTTGFSSPQADRLSRDAADSSASDGRRDLENRTFDRPSKWQGNRRDDTFVK